MTIYYLFVINLFKNIQIMVFIYKKKKKKKKKKIGLYNNF